MSLIYFAGLGDTQGPLFWFPSDVRQIFTQVKGEYDQVQRCIGGADPDFNDLYNEFNAYASKILDQWWFQMSGSDAAGAENYRSKLQYYYDKYSCSGPRPENPGSFLGGLGSNLDSAITHLAIIAGVGIGVYALVQTGTLKKLAQKVGL